MTSWSFNPIYSIWTLILMGIVLLGVLLVRPSFGNLSRRRWITLIALRGCVILLLLICMVRPGFKTTITKPQTAVLNLLIDVSRSMDLPHEAGEVTRFQAVEEVLKKNRQKLARLKDEKIELRVFGFDRDLYPLELNNSNIVLPGKPDGNQTDMLASISQSFRGSHGKRLAGTILMGDGRKNVADPKVHMAEAMSGFVSRKVPLFSIPFGREEDSGQFQDLEITGMDEQYSAQIKNELQIDATLKSRGFVNREIPIQLLVTDSQGQTSVVQTLRKRITQANQEIPLVFQYIPEKPGQYTIEVVAESQNLELVTKNNRLPAFLTVDAEGLRVLYLYGKEGLEQLFLKKSIGAARGIGLKPEYIDPESRARWPLDRSSAFENELYDVIIFHDVDASAFYKKGDERSCLKTLVDQIQKGKGFLMIGGNHSFGAGGYYNTPLGDILPIEMSEFKRQSFGTGKRRADLHVPGPHELVPTRSHFLLNLFGENNRENWSSQLPPLTSLNRFEGIKPSGRILLQSRDSDPVLIQGNFGGRMLLFAGDSTWKWWTSGKKDIHKRFWRQVILWLAHRDGSQNSNLIVDFPQRRLNPGIDAKFTCKAISALGEPLPEAKFRSFLTDPEGVENEVPISQVSEASAGLISGELLAKPGVYSLAVSAVFGEQDLGSTRIQFVVLDRDSEKANPQADPDRLRRLALRTSDFGGRVVIPDDFGALIDEIIDAQKKTYIQIEYKWELGDTWKSGLLVTMAFVLFFGIEWFLRKKWGMV